MKFVNREDEMKTLGQLLNLSERKAFLIGLYGLRRVGKTRLAKEFIKDKDFLYFFVYENKTSSNLLQEYESELRKGVLGEMEKLKNWNDFVKVIFERCRNKIVVFDEFQNFWGVDPSIFSVIQRYADEYENSPIMVIFLGSLIGLFKNTFEDKKQPLYGRLKNKIKLLPMDFRKTREMLKILGYNEIADHIRFYSLFGGFPKYYVAIDDYRLNKKSFMDVIEYLFLRQESPLKDEVEDILKQEFGKRKSLYYSILYAVATGKTRVNEIASSVQLKESSISRHLNELVNYFEFISKESTVFEEKKKTIYRVNHPLIDFWFKYIYRNYSKYKIGYFDQIKSLIKSDINTLVGKRFEFVCREFLLETRPAFKVDKLGPWWGYYRDREGRKEIEIDLVGLNEETGQILFVECKWKDRVNPERLLSELREKAGFVNWNRGNRKEYYCIIAKSFREKPKLDNCLLFDLNDIEKAF